MMKTQLLKKYHQVSVKIMVMTQLMVYFQNMNHIFLDAPILRKLINDDIGLNAFDEILTYHVFKQNFYIESQVIEI